MEYLKEDFKLIEEEEERVVNFKLLFVLEIGESGREVRANENETVSFSFAEKEVKRKKENRRNMQNETEENRAIGNREKIKRWFFFIFFFYFELYEEVQATVSEVAVCVYIAK